MTSQPEKPTDPSADDLSLQRTMLRRLFREPVFNQRDGLDDYDSDFKSFHNLVDVITSDMRHRMENVLRENQPPDSGRGDGRPDSAGSRTSDQPFHSGFPDISKHPASPVPIKLFSRGKIVIIGDPARAMKCIRQLKNHLTCTLLIVSDTQHNWNRTTNTDIESVSAVYSRTANIEGAFTRFTVSVQDNGSLVTLGSLLGREWETADLILDLQPDPYFPADYSQPMGYFAPGDDENTLEDILLRLKNMTGEFEKDIFITYDSARCGHYGRGIYGCSRCIEYCPANAISSGPAGIEIDHLLCRGCGVCSLGCPGGAISSLTPGIHKLLERARQYLESVSEKGITGILPVIAIHETGSNPVTQLSSMKVPDGPEPIFYLPVDSMGSAGMESWLTFLALGFDKILLYLPQGTEPVTVVEMERQVNIAIEILKGIGLSADCISIVKSPGRFDEISSRENIGIKPISPPGPFNEALDLSHDKRSLILKSIQDLYNPSSALHGRTELPAGAPFGEILISKEKCTFCMACAAVCPAEALSTGTDHPQLTFREAECRQCGICVKACPENAITLHPGLALPPEKAYANRILAEEPPFLCVKCGKPFAASAAISMITDKLRGHWMYQNEEALNRLRMCRECRISDIFNSDKNPIFE